MTFSRKRVIGNNPAAGQPLSRGNVETHFEMLFQQHWARICAVLYRLVGDWDEAEDLAVDAFWQLYSQPPRQDHNLAGWLYRVATNLGFNALRARKRRQHYEQESGYRILVEDAPVDPARQAEQSLERRQVRQVLTLMKPRSAELLVLRHSGLSYAEIGAALDLAPGSVGTLLARAEQEFEQIYLQEEGGQHASQ